MKIIEAKNGVLVKAVKDTVGAYLNAGNERVTVNHATKIAAPDSVDLSEWQERESVEAFVKELKLEYKPLTEEEVKEIREAERRAYEEKARK